MSSSSCAGSSPGWRGGTWPDFAKWGKAKPLQAETPAAQQSAPRNTPPTAPCHTNRDTHQQSIYTRASSNASPENTHTPRAVTHLSTESKVFLSGGGRAFSLLGVGGSLSVCGGGRLGSVVADGGRRGDEERQSFHPACRQRSHKLFFKWFVFTEIPGERWPHVPLTSLEPSRLRDSEGSAVLELSGARSHGGSSAGCVDGEDWVSKEKWPPPTASLSFSLSRSLSRSRSFSRSLSFPRPPPS